MKILQWPHKAQPAALPSCPQRLHKQLQSVQALTKCQQVAQHHQPADVTTWEGWNCAPASRVQLPRRPSLASGKDTHDNPFEIFTENMTWPLQPLPKAVDRQNRSWKFVLLGPRTQKWRRQPYPFPRAHRGKVGSSDEILRLSMNRQWKKYYSRDCWNSSRILTIG